MKDLTKNIKCIVKCEKGFVNAEWVNGRKYPECWGFSNYEAKTYSYNRAQTLIELLENNNHAAYYIQIL